TNLPKQPAGNAQLKGYGGGPDIRVTPSPTLNFGKVAYFANTPTSRKLTVSNVGTKPATPDPKANLLLGVNGAGAPYIDVKALNADSDPSEITIINPPMPAAGVSGGYDPNLGLVASAGQNSCDFQIQLTPTGVALKQYELTV